METWELFSAAIKNIHKDHKWGWQAKLAEAANIDAGYLSKLLTGDKKGSDATRARIAAALGMTYEDMLALGRRLLTGEIRPGDALALTPKIGDALADGPKLGDTMQASTGPPPPDRPQPAKHADQPQMVDQRDLEIERLRRELAELKQAEAERRVAELEAENARLRSGNVDGVESEHEDSAEGSPRSATA